MRFWLCHRQNICTGFSELGCMRPPVFAHILPEHRPERKKRSDEKEKERKKTATASPTSRVERIWGGSKDCQEHLATVFKEPGTYCSDICTRACVCVCVRVWTHVHLCTDGYVSNRVKLWNLSASGRSSEAAKELCREMKDLQILNTRSEVDVCEREHVSAEIADKEQGLFPLRGWLCKMLFSRGMKCQRQRQEEERTKFGGGGGWRGVCLMSACRWCVIIRLRVKMD